MRVVVTLLGVRGRILLKAVLAREGARLAVIALFALLFGGVMVGEYRLFRQGLAEVLSIGPPAGRSSSTSWRASSSCCWSSR